MSRFTSLVAVDQTPSRPTEAPLHKTQIPNVLPAGSHFAQTASTARLRALLALLLVLLAVLTWFMQGRTARNEP